MIHYKKQTTQRMYCSVTASQSLSCASICSVPVSLEMGERRNMYDKLSLLR